MVDTKSSAAFPVHILPPKVNRTTISQDAPQASAAGAKVAPVSVGVAKPGQQKSATRRVSFSTTPFWAGISLSIAWATMVVFALLQGGSSYSFAGVSLSGWAVAVCAVTAPIGLIWMVAAYMQRASDVQAMIDPLRRQLLMITGESGIAEQRIRRFNVAIKEQLELLRSTKASSQDDLMAIVERVNQHKRDLEQFESNSLNQVKEIQEVVRRSMQYIEQQMEDKFTMLRILDGKLAQNSEGLSHQTDKMREQLSGLLQEIEANSNLISISLERALRDSKKLSDTARAQETSIVSAADTAANTLGELSTKMDTNIASFLERTSRAREEAERLANAIDAQTRSLDELSTVLPTRVGDAEAVLRGVADRLYASEQLAREQSINLSDKLSAQVDNLQKVLDQFSSRCSSIDGTLSQRRGDLDSLVVRIGSAAEDISKQIEDSVVGMGNRADDVLNRYRKVNEEARKGADGIASQMSETAARYESAAAHLNTVATASNAQMKALNEEIRSHMAQFDSLQNTARQAGEEVQTRTATATQNLQYVLERLLAARDAAHLVGDSLTNKMKAAVDENEIMITRINEAAQMSVRAISLATEALGKQEGEVEGRARAAETALKDTMDKLQAYAAAAEKSMREQNQTMNSLLHEAMDCVKSTESNLNDFSDRAIQPVKKAMLDIEKISSDGLSALDNYSHNMENRLGDLQQFNSRVNEMSNSVAQNTTEALTVIEKLNARFLDLRADQDAVARATIEQFNVVADRLKGQVGLLGVQSSSAVSLLHDATQRISVQSSALLHDAQDSGAKIQAVTASLQNEAVKTKEILQKQAEELIADLGRADQQFISLGNSLKEKTDSAYALIDRIAVHYSETTRKTSDEIDVRTAKLDHTTTEATSKIENLNAALLQQLNLIGNGATQLDVHASQLSAISGKALQQLTSLGEKFVSTHDITEKTTQSAISKLEEAANTFLRQQGTLSDTASNAAATINRASGSFNEQATKMIEVSTQAEQQVRNLSTTSMALADQSAQFRNTIEQQSRNLIADLGNAVTSMEATSFKLQQAVEAATVGADRAGERFNTMTQAASERINASSENLISLADRTEKSLGSLGACVTQQTASLNLVSEQLSGQQDAFAVSNEAHRNKMLELFEQLSSAHNQAGEVADRTIARLSDSLQQIQRQLGAVSDQSQSAVASVRNASGGFADQAGILLQHAQQAEQQARMVLSVTASLQEQAQQMRDTMQQESDKAGNSLTTLLSKITAGGKDLRDIATSTEGSLTNLHMDVSKQVTELSSTMQQINDKQRTLTTALDAQRDVLNGLLSRFNMAQEETSSMAERSVARLTDSAQQVAKQVEAIDSQTKSALASVRMISGSFADEAGTLQLHTQQAEQQMRNMLTVASGLQDQAKQMSEIIGNESTKVVASVGAVTTQLETTAGQLRQQSASAVNSVEEASGKFENIINDSCDKLMKQADSLVATATAVEGSAVGVSEKIRASLRLVNEEGDVMDGKAKKLADTAEYASNRLATLRDTINACDSDGQVLMAKASERIEQVKAKLYDELQHIADVSDTAVRLIQAAGESLVTQSDSIRSNLATSESAIAEAASLMREEGNQLPAVLDRGVQQIEAAKQSLKDQATAANDALIKTADRFINVTGAVRDTMVEDVKELDSVTVAAEQTLRSFTQALAEQLSAMQKGSTNLAGEQRTLVDAAGQALSQLMSASERLHKLHQDAASTTDQLSRAFATVEQRADAADRKLSQITINLAQQVETLANTANGTEKQMVLASQSFREQLERIRSGVQTQIDDINRGLMQITAQLERTGSTLKASTSATIADMEKISDQFDATSSEAANQLTDRTTRMRTATEEVAKLLNGFGDQLDTLLDRLSTAGDGIKRHESDLLGKLQTALGHLGTVSERLEANRLLTANVSDQAVARLSEVAQILDKQMKDFSADSDTVSSIMEGVGRMYDSQTQTLNRGVADAQNQVVAMEQTIGSLQQRTDRMRVSLKMQGEELIESLEQILHQLATAGDLVTDTVDDLAQRSGGSKAG